MAKNTGGNSVHEQKSSFKRKKLSSARMRFFRSKIFMSQNDFWHLSLAAFIQNALRNLILLVPSKNIVFGLHKTCAARGLKILVGIQFTNKNPAPNFSKNANFSFKNIYVTKWFLTFFIDGLQTKCIRKFHFACIFQKYVVWDA